jgi:hypothetical protein
MNGEAPEPTRLDGNSAAGLLSEIFMCDMTSARATCAHCGVRGDIGALMLYDAEMGPVLRCPACEAVVLRLTRTTTHVWLDATGARSIAIAMP